MYKLLVGLMLLAAIQELGSGSAFGKADNNRSSLIKIEKASLKVLKVNWRPITIFPHEARRFK